MTNDKSQDAGKVYQGPGGDGWEVWEAVEEGCLGELRVRVRSVGMSGGLVYECVVVGTGEAFFLVERTLREFWREAG